jgi:hypothetical protein
LKTVSRARQAVRALLAPRPGTVRRIPLGPSAGVRLGAAPEPSLDQWLGLYESELAPWVRRLCRPGVRCVDVGAYDGLYALTFAKLTRAPVISYEADPAAVARCRANLAHNPALAPLITLREAFIGRDVTLDDEVSTAGLLKIDVEGAEFDVLSGARGLLARQRPHLIVETHAPGLEDACAALLIEHGYAPRVLTPRRLLPSDRPATRRPGAHNRWLVAVHPAMYPK